MLCYVFLHYVICLETSYRTAGIRTIKMVRFIVEMSNVLAYFLILTKKILPIPIIYRLGGIGVRRMYVIRNSLDFFFFRYRMSMILRTNVTTRFSFYAEMWNGWK